MPNTRRPLRVATLALSGALTTTIGAGALAQTTPTQTPSQNTKGAAEAPDGTPGVQGEQGLVYLAAPLRKGRTHRFTYEMDVRQVESGFFGEQSQRLGMMLDVTVEPIRMGEDGGEARVRFERIAIRAEGAHLGGRFDSARNPADDGDDLFARAMRPIVGVPFTVRLSLDREIESIEGLSEFAPSGESERMIFDAFFGEATLAQTLQALFRVKGDPTTAAVGERWTESRMQATNFGRMETSFEHTLERIEDGAAVVTIGGAIALADARPTNEMAAKVTSSSIEGECRWSNAAGGLQSYASSVEVSMEAGGEGLTLSATLSTDISIQRIGDSGAAEASVRNRD